MVAGSPCGHLSLFQDLPPKSFLRFWRLMYASFLSDPNPSDMFYSIAWQRGRPCLRRAGGGLVGRDPSFVIYAANWTASHPLASPLEGVERRRTHAPSFGKSVFLSA